jgi:hypothetical protein
MLDEVNRIRGVAPPKPPEPSGYNYFRDTRDLHFDRVLIPPRPTWKDRLVRRIARRLIVNLMVDDELRRKLCLTMAGEFREIDIWLDKPAPKPPNPNKK